MSMTSQIYELARVSPDVQNILGGDVLRVYPFGTVDSTVDYPYAVWQNTSGTPANYLHTRPDVDNYIIQVDVYSKLLADVLAAAEALRDAVEGDGYITRWGDQSFETDTKIYRYSFDVEFYTLRG